MLLPRTTEAGALRKLTARSAAGLTMVVAEAWLLPGSGSIWSAEAAAVAVMVPCAPGVTTMVAVARPPLFKLPKLKRTTLPLITVRPWEALAERMPTLEGRLLPTRTPGAVLGPFLVTETG